MLSLLFSNYQKLFFYFFLFILYSVLIINFILFCCLFFLFQQFSNLTPDNNTVDRTSIHIFRPQSTTAGNHGSTDQCYSVFIHSTGLKSLGNFNCLCYKQRKQTQKTKPVKENTQKKKAKENISHPLFNHLLQFSHLSSVTIQSFITILRLFNFSRLLCFWLKWEKKIPFLWTCSSSLWLYL